MRISSYETVLNVVMSIKCITKHLLPQAFYVLRIEVVIRKVDSEVTVSHVIRRWLVKQTSTTHGLEPLVRVVHPPNQPRWPHFFASSRYQRGR
jgi:hypothetical protein